VLALARAVVVLFLVVSEERVRRGLGARIERQGRSFRKAPAQTRNLLTWFGVVQYARTYLREIVKPKQPARGYHPLDAELGLLADRVSPNVLSVTTRLSTRLSFAEAREVAGWFLPMAPSTVEKGRAGERYLVSAVNLTIEAFFARLERISGVKGPRIRTPRSLLLARAGAEIFGKLQKHVPLSGELDRISAEMAQVFWYVDTSKAKNELGWDPMDPGETLAETVEDLRGRGIVWPE